MSYEVLYHPKVKVDISSFPKNIKLRIRKAIENRLCKDPVHYGDPLKKSLQGYRKLRVGDYRVIYRVQKDRVIILLIGHRKEVYEDIYERVKNKKK